MTLFREEMVQRIMWNEGGHGFGICEVATAFAWATARPTPEIPDLISVVAVSGPPEKYTDEELQKLLEFSEKATAHYDKYCSTRLGANLILISKYEKSWKRKRLTWNQGPMFSPTLDEALHVFSKDWGE